MCRACYGVLRFIMESGAKGCEVIVSGKLRAQRAKAMKFKDGYMVSSGNPVEHYIDGAIRHVLLRQGVLGIKVCPNTSPHTQSDLVIVTLDTIQFTGTWCQETGSVLAVHVYKDIQDTLTLLLGTRGVVVTSSDCTCHAPMRLQSSMPCDPLRVPAAFQRSASFRRSPNAPHHSKGLERVALPLGR